MSEHLHPHTPHTTHHTPHTHTHTYTHDPPHSNELNLSANEAAFTIVSHYPASRMTEQADLVKVQYMYMVVMWYHINTLYMCTRRVYRSYCTVGADDYSFVRTYVQYVENIQFTMHTHTYAAHIPSLIPTVCSTCTYVQSKSLSTVSGW